MLKFNTVDHDPFEAHTLEKAIPTNGPQQEIWLSCILGDEPASLSYNELVSLRLKGTLELAAFQEATQLLTDRHEALRCMLSTDGESLLVQKTILATLPILDITDEPVEKQQQILSDYAHEEVNTPFDLYNGPLFRMALHILGADQFQFSLTVHHIIADGWSLGVLIDDLSKIYNAILTHSDVSLLDAPAQLSQYVLHQIAFQETDQYKKNQDYWYVKLRNANPTPAMPIDFARPPIRSYRGKRLDFTLPPDIYRSLIELASKAQISLTFVTLCAFETFMRKHMGLADVSVGLPTAGQVAMDNPNIVGHCVHFLPIISHSVAGESFFDYLIRRKKALSHDLIHKSITFSEILKSLSIPRDKNRIPYVPVAFNMDVGMDEGIQFLDLQHALISHPRSYENFDLFLNLSGNQEKIVCEWSYNTDIFNETTIINYHLYYVDLLRQLVKDPYGPVDLPAPSLPAAEQETEHTEHDLVALFEAAVERYGAKYALIEKDRKLSYTDLNKKVNQLAAYLLSQKVQAGNQIGITTDRSTEMLIALLAIVKIGAVLVPIDAKFPKQRKLLLIDNLHLLFVLSTRTEEHDTIGEYGYLKEYAVDVLLTKAVDLPAENPSVSLAFHRPVYILHTSGSTGLPKGVRMNQPALSNIFRWQVDLSQVDSNHSTLQFSPLNFDVSFQEIFSTFFIGGTLVLVDDETRLDPSRLLPHLIKHQINRLFLPFVALQSLVEVADAQQVFPPSLLEVVTAGEQLKITPQVIRFFSNIPHCALFNHYGPTETHIVTSLKLTGDPNGWPALPSIGSEITHTEIFVLDKQDCLVPDGTAGELCISGVCLADGYENQDKETSVRFPLWWHPDGRTIRIYKSGDLAKRLPDGNIQFLGRLDDQVKIRGFRVELSEIEYYLNQEHGVRQSIVVAKTDTALQNTRLIAYLTVNDRRATVGQPSNGVDWKEQWNHLYSNAQEAQEEHQDKDLDTLVFTQLGTFENAEMHAQEWLSQTVQRIHDTVQENFSTAPIKMLEIGCGGGQLLYALAPTCTHYYASDYSAVAIQNLDKHLTQAPQNKNITLSISEANDLRFLEGQRVDLIIINSVVQYFTDENYLYTVIEKSLEHLTPNGCIYIGDIQVRETLAMCLMGEQLRHVNDEVKISRFRETIEHRLATEDEFILDPDFFYHLPERFTTISHVDIQLRKGQLLNETTKYHYDVWLYRDTEIKTIEPKQCTSWEQLGSLSQLRMRLQQHTLEALLIQNIPNKRCAFDYQLAAAIQVSAGHRTLGDIKGEIAGTIIPGQDPDALWQLGNELGFDTYIRWSTTGIDNQMEAAFIPKVLHSRWAPSKKRTIQHFHPEKKAFSIIENSTIATLTAQYKNNLKQKLPDYMIPDRLLVIDRFPLTSTGKIDRKALLTLEPPSRHVAVKNQKHSHTEQFLEKIWCKLLALPQVGMDEDFFELGGHSLLAIKIMVAIEKEYGIKLPLAVLFDYPTIEKLASQIQERIQSRTAASYEWNALVPIRKSGSKPPLYLIHGAGLNVLLFKSVVRHLDPDQPVYGIQALGQNGKMDFYNDIHQIAAKYNEDLLKNNPHGPYRIGGYSYGGFLAFEMARQLTAMGKQVDIVAIFDTYVGEIAHASTSVSTLLKKGVFVAKTLYKNPLRYLSYSLFLMKLKFQFMFSKVHIEHVEAFAHEKKIVQAYKEAFKQYELKPQDIDIILFKAKQVMQYYEEPHFMGWKKYARQVSVYDIPGEHKTIFYPPNDQGLAKVLKQALDDTIKDAHPVL